MVDVYKDVSYKLDQDAYTVAEYNDIVRKRFVRMWSTLLDGFKVRPSIPFLNWTTEALMPIIRFELRKP